MFDARQGSGWHLLQIPGPSNVPHSVLQAIAMPTIDHRGERFAELTHEIQGGLRRLFGASGPIIIFPSSGTGAWEAALCNTTTPGDHVLIAETGHFSQLWVRVAERIGLAPGVLPGDWRRGACASAIEERLRADKAHSIRAVCVVHNETSTGATSRIPAIREAIDRCGHPALLLVDVISSLGSMDYRHDEWGADVTIGCSQKGLMLPPGLAFNAVSEKALAASRNAGSRRSYFDWQAMIDANRTGQFPYTPATNLLFGLREALRLLDDEGLPNVFRRHDILAEATRSAVRSWGLEIVCAEPEEYSSTLTAVMMPEGFSADALRAHILRRSNIALGNGLSRLADRAFRVGHLGNLNAPMLLATLAGIEMGLLDMQIPVRASGIPAAMSTLRTGEMPGRPAE